MAFIYYLNGDYKKANEWEERAVAERSPGAYLLNIPLLFDKEYFESRAHQQILKKMGFVK